MRNRLSIAAAACAIASATAASPASAGIWTEIPSGTTQNITAIEYQSASRFWFTTAAGAIFTRQPNGTFAQTRAPGGVPLNDIEFQPGGQIGFAVGNGGLVLRSIDGGASWTPITGIPVSTTGTAFVNCTASAPLGDVNAVRFASNARVWIFAGGSQLATSQPANPAQVGAQGTWADANRDTRGTASPADDVCKLPSLYANGYADAFFPSPDVGYFVSAIYSEVFFSANNLASTAAKKPVEAGNAGTIGRVIAGDPQNPSRMWTVDAQPYGRSTTSYTRDGYQTEDSWQIGNPAAREFPTTGPADVDYAGGTVLSAGLSGLVLNSIDGVTFFYNPADGALATQRWNAAGLASASDGAIGGDNGKLAITTAANTIPDVVPPTGTISGPSTAVAGQPVTFSAAVSDNVGVESYAWTVNGGAAGSGPTMRFAFGGSGTYTVRLSFRDRAGNAATASKTVSVSAAPRTTTTTTQSQRDTRPLPAITGSKVSAKLRGGKVKVVIEGKLKAAACSGTVQLTIKKGSKLLTARNAKLGSRCTFAKTVSLAKSKVGGAKQLSITVRFAGNSRLKPSARSMTVKIKH